MKSLWYRWAVRQTLSGSSSIKTTLDSSDVHHGIGSICANAQRQRIFWASTVHRVDKGGATSADEVSS